MKKNYYLLYILFLIILSSCSETNFYQECDLRNEDNLNSTELTEDTVLVNINEINNVIDYLFGSSKSRSTTFTLSKIEGSNGEDLLYVVNYKDNGGFALVSATKDFYPILAYNKFGTFDLGNIPEGGLKEWFNNSKTAIAKSKHFPQEEKIKFRMMWKQFENQKILNSSNKTKGIEDLPIDYYELLRIKEAKKSELAKQGYRIFPVSGEYITGGPLDEEMAEYVKGGIHPEYQEFWYELSFIAYYPYPRVTLHIDDFINSEWKQYGGYNSEFPFMPSGAKYPVGCGPLAVGQVMRYYQYPTSYNWSDMPLDKPTATTCKFLRNVADGCKANYSIENLGTSTTINDCCTYLQSKGYMASLESDNYNKTLENLKQYKPVIMRGAKKGNNTGHIWICSGAHRAEYHELYEVWTFTTRTNFKSAYTFYGTNHRYENLLYMRWRLDDKSFDGFYSTLENPEIAFTENRQSIYNIEPIK